MVKVEDASDECSTRSVSPEPAQDEAKPDTSTSSAAGATQPAIIVIMGPTGAGKSTFANLISGSDFQVGHGLQSCTSTISVTPPFDFEGRPIVLVDTPGFDDTTRSEREILQEISAFLTESYKKGTQINGVLYLHRIIDNRVGGVALRNFGLFRKLCGPEALKNVTIATTMWQQTDAATAIIREEELKSSKTLFRLAIEGGASLKRHLGTKDSAQDLLRGLIGNKPKPLKIQQEIVDEKKALNETDAGIELDGKLKDLMAKYEKALKELNESIKEARDGERAELERERNEMKRRIEKTKQDRENMAEQFKEQQKKVNKIEQMKAAAEIIRVAGPIVVDILTLLA